MEIIFLIVILILAFAIFYICRDRNSWDVLAFNTTLCIVSLFVVGLLVSDKDVWFRVIGFLGVVATGSAFASIFRTKK